MPTLNQLLREIAVIRVTGDRDRDIAAIAYDSRRVEPGALFVAIPGFKLDGHRFIPDAVARGAAAVVYSDPAAEIPPDVAAVQVVDCRLALSALAAAFHDHPSRRCRLVGVTGTNGKTTTVHLIAAVLKAAGYNPATIGTLGIRWAGGDVPLARTTPEAPDIHGTIAELVAQGVDAVVMEVSSHALELHRADHLAFDAAVFTNLTQDHLDFHDNIEEYRAAKALLFTRSAEFSGRSKPFGAVINWDDPAGRWIAEHCSYPVLSYGVDTQANLSASGVEIKPTGASFVTTFSGTRMLVKLQLTGRFNMYNALAAFGVGLLWEIDPNVITAGLEGVDRLPGRLEIIDEDQPFTVAVDYAHTPDGLKNVITTAREFTRGRVLTVFGCGGDRDRTKRSRMGAVVSSFCEVTIVTSDNPRSEDPMAIIEEIRAGVEPTTELHIEPDRRAAIELAMRLAQPNDFVLIAGKGHEREQILKDRTIDFDDREEARTALRKCHG